MYDPIYISKSETVNSDLCWFELADSLDNPETSGAMFRIQDGECRLNLWDHASRFSELYKLNKEQLLELSQWAKEAAQCVGE